MATALPGDSHQMTDAVKSLQRHLALESDSKMHFSGFVETSSACSVLYRSKVECVALSSLIPHHPVPYQRD